ncbi:hypothetical protein ACO2Q1_05320 [Brevundimonas sp. VNH65]|uniref:hypothetical protein n=1 Tax=Brevundimonas sp. VNH65 TaxID=3400917 RepID=UPI003C03E30E
MVRICYVVICVALAIAVFLVAGWAIWPVSSEGELVARTLARLWGVLAALVICSMTGLALRNLRDLAAPAVWIEGSVLFVRAPFRGRLSLDLPLTFRTQTRRSFLGRNEQLFIRNAKGNEVVVSTYCLDLDAQTLEARLKRSA